ncbi:MAG: helix-turn-helix domain-containing protein [Muribaculaceae bacterium]|nr:helix-turn-helix domain-containing protein [Muribaculaceae bacterium]
MKNEKLLILGQKIRFERLKKEYSQEELAEKTNLSRRAISCIECGTNDPKYTTLLKIAEALEIDVSVLFKNFLSL